MRLKLIAGFALIAVGAVLALFFWDAEFEWFQGGPLGLGLVALGVLDLIDEYRKSQGKKPRTLMDDLREDFGGKKSRDRDDDDR